jgi:hypothetical protein
MHRRVLAGLVVLLSTFRHADRCRRVDHECDRRAVRLRPWEPGFVRAPGPSSPRCISGLELRTVELLAVDHPGTGRCVRVEAGRAECSARSGCSARAADAGATSARQHTCESPLASRQWISSFQIPKPREVAVSAEQLPHAVVEAKGRDPAVVKSRTIDLRLLCQAGEHWPIVGGL